MLYKVCLLIRWYKTIHALLFAMENEDIGIGAE